VISGGECDHGINRIQTVRLIQSQLEKTSKEEMKMSKRSLYALAAVLGCTHSVPSHADVWCTLTSFSIDAYDHGGVYLHGTLSGQTAQFLVLCGAANGQQDCESRATERRLALALAAQSAGKSLNLLFTGLSSCAPQAYARPVLVQVAP
jgi:hypothetical protein